MNGYQILRAGVTATIQYGTAVAATVTSVAMRALNDRRMKNRFDPDGKPHKRPMQDAAIDLAFAAGGFVIGDQLAERTGAWMDKVHDKVMNVIKLGKTEKKTEEEPITVDFEDL